MAKVLVIDDDADLLALHTEVLKSDGHEVITAERGEQGIKLAERHRPDCILLDLLMDDMDGLDALTRLNEWDPDIPIVIFTGYPSAENAIEALRRGAFDFLTKGCSIEEVITTTKRAIETRRLQFENKQLLQQLRQANANLEQQINEATAKIRSLNEFNQSLLEGIDAGLLAADANERILFANRGALRDLQMSSAEIIGRELSEFDFHTEFASVEKRNETPHLGAEVHGDDLSSVEKQIGRSQRKAKFTVADGTQRSFGYSISVPENIPGSGPGHGYIVLFRDVTEMEELRLHMHRLEKLEALNILIAGVAHEIKNPVAGIKSVASVLIDMFEAEDERREYVSRILDETGRVIRLVQDFFSFSRPSKPRRELLEITDCIGGVVRLMDDTAKQHSIRITTEISPDLPLVRVDRDQVKQIILNLVTNSIQAVEDEGTIEITADKMYYRVLEKDCLCVRVHDSGPGFSDEVRNKLFDPFFTTKQSGTGLGLHISQNIMLEHGGRMEALNHPIGGAEICLYFPLEDGSE